LNSQNNCPRLKVVQSTKNLKLGMPPKKRLRPIDESISDSEDEEISNTCRGCQKTLTTLGYLKKHLERFKTDCMKKYSDDEYQSLGHKNKAKKRKKQSDRENANSQSISQKQALKYQKNKEKHAEQY
jgi:hypothetical protein